MRRIKRLNRVIGPSWWKTACATCVLCAATATALLAQTYTTIQNFNETNGGYPLYMSLVQGLDGDLYGTTSFWGAHGVGTVFKIATTGTLTALYSFCAQPKCADGSEPYAGLALGTDGNFYGTTAYGGTGPSCSKYGCGTVFKITPAGTFTTLHSFGGPDGSFVVAGLALGTDGNFYGTAEQGGASASCSGGCGTVFKITPAGTLTTLHSFNSNDGAQPWAGLFQGTDGNFYGTTKQGGVHDCFGGCGTVFKITPGGTLTPLLAFNQTNGEFPLGPVMQATDGNFYGTTEEGGAYGQGTVFKMTPGGTLTTLYSFCDAYNCPDGAGPVAPLIEAGHNFYGITPGGGKFIGFGTIFRITPEGVHTILHSFGNSDRFDLTNSYGGLVQSTNGTFYGATYIGGPYTAGTVFSLSVGLGPFVETQPTAGKVGTGVNILGTNLTGATSVTFDGRAAAFTVASSSLITTTIPTGAASGTVQVTTPSGTLTSHVPFRVLQ